MSGLMGAADGGLIVKRLSQDAVFRIEVSLSSRKSSAIVMRTTARLYSLQGTAGGGGASGDAEWKNMAYGAPCIQLMRETTEHNSPFHIKIVIAEVESGISLWEEVLGNNSGYQAMQSNFHTFSAKNSTFAIQFASEEEAVRMLESLQDLFLQKEKAETVSFEKKLSDEAIFKKPKNFRRLSKKDISAPCNFKHVSGITLQRTQACEEELRGTIQRKMRSMSLSSLMGRRIKPRTRLPGDMTDGSIYMDNQQGSPELQRRGEGQGEGQGEKGEGTRRSSVLQKFNSLRLMKRRSPKQMRKAMDYPGEQQHFTRDEKRMSLPSHFRHQTRPLLDEHTFSHPQSGAREQRSPDRQLSLSSGNLVDMPSSTPPPQQTATLDRRHTMIDYGSRQGSQYNYTPYSAAPTTRVAPPTSSQQQPHPLSNRQYMSDMSLHQNPYNRMPVGNGVMARGVPGVQGMPGERGVQGPQARGLQKRRSFTEAQLQGGVNWERDVPPEKDRQTHMANGRIVQVQPGVGPHGQSGSRIPPSSSAGSIPETAGTKLHPGAMAFSMDSVRMLPDGVAPVDSSGMHNYVGGMHTSAGDVRVPPSSHKAARLTSYPVNGNLPPSPTDPAPYATTAVAMRRTVSASSATQQNRRPMSATAATHLQNGRPREFKPGSTAQYDLLTPRNRPLPPTPMDHMQVLPKRQQQQPRYQLPPQVGLQSQTQNPRQQAQGRIPSSQMQPPRTHFEYPGPGAYPQYLTRPQTSQGQLPQRQTISQRLPQGYTTFRAPPPVSYPQAGASRMAQTRVSSSHERTQVSPAQAHARVSPSHVVSPAQAHTQVSPSHVVSPTQAHTQVSPSHLVSPAQAHTQVSPSHVKTIVSPAQAHTQVSPSHAKTIVSPAQAHTQVSPSHAKTIVSPAQAHARVSPSHEKAQVSPAQPQLQVPVTQPVPAHVPLPTHTGSSQQQNPSSKQSSSKKYKPPTENYDMLLPKGVQSLKNTPGSRDSTSSLGSLSAELQEYTDQMSRALEQFDSLLAPPPKRHIMQTSL